MNFCPGELILKLLARIGEWHLKLSEKTVMYNGNPARGHYSPIRRTWKDLQYDANEIEPITFSPNYKMEVDLDEHLNRRDYIWDLDMKRCRNGSSVRGEGTCSD